MKFPYDYRWLNNEHFPAILRHAKALYGVAEKPGPGSNPEIMRWAKELGREKLGIEYLDDDVAWCGLFMGVCAQRSGNMVPSICVRAKSWLTYGTPSPEPMLGDVLVFNRNGGGHVGLYVGEDAECYHVLGGNQADSVNIARIAKSRLTEARRTRWKIAQPSSVRKIFLAPNGAVSENEA